MLTPLEEGVLPAGLKDLELGWFFDHPLEKSVLPAGLTHLTLAKRYGYSLCDMHGGAIKKTITQFGVSEFAPSTAHEFANIVNGCITGLEQGDTRHPLCTAYAMASPAINFNPS